MMNNIDPPLIQNIADATLFALSFYAWLCAGLTIVLYSMAFFSKKFGLISSFILSIIIVWSAIFGGRSAWFAEKFGWIMEDEKELVSGVWFLLLSVSGTLSVRYLLLRQTRQEIAEEVEHLKNKAMNRQIWKYIVGAFVALAVLVFFLRLSHA